LARGPGSSSVSSSIMMDMVGDAWPMIRFLLDDEVYREIYKDEVRAVLDGAFATDVVHERMDRYHAMISPYVVGPEATESEPYTQLARGSDFENALTDSRDGLKNHVEDRHGDAWSQVSAD
jgi:spore coat protein H